MYNDLSYVNLDSATCVYIPDVNKLGVATSTDESIYVLQGNTYYLSQVNPTPPTTVYHCLADTNIQSHFDFVTPAYYGLAFAAFLIVIYAAYFVVLRPWFRSKV